MTSIEIEDVLSSIRRLVSEDLRPTHRLVSAALEKNASKLILTPALRIVPDVRTALPERGDGPGETPNLQCVLQEIEDGGMQKSADIMPMFGSVRLNEPFVLTSPAKVGTSERVTSDTDFLTTAMSRINGLTAGETTPVLPPQAETIEAVVASVGAAVGLDEWEPDGGEPSPDTKAWPELAWNSDVAADNGVVHAEMVEDVSPPEILAGSDSIAETVAYDVQTETVVAASPTPDYEPLGGYDSIVFQDATETLVLEAPSVPSDDEEFDDSASFISEDLLREIVRDMIREELQGNLGERITRNVRKLVRSEINRALASRDFDDVASQG